MNIIIRLLKIVAVNILVFLGMLIFINLAAIAIYQLCNLKIFSAFDTDPRSSLPNYKNIEWASIHFKELQELQREHRSYIGWRHLPYRGQTINIDEKGIRITPQSKLVKKNSPLVVFLGGSTMWGDGVNDANTIPALFAQIAKGRYRTMNLGETGYVAFQSYLFLKMQIIDGLKPDVVVSYDGVNDALALYPGLRPFSHLEESRIRKAMKEQHRKKEEALSFSHFFQDPLKCFISHYKIADDDSKDYYLFLSHDRIEKTAEALLESWLSTKDLAEKNGAVFIGILQPTPAIGEPYGEHLHFKKEKYLPFYKNFYPAVLKLLKTPKYEEMSNNVIVLTNIFDLKEPIYIDDCHVSPNGNKIISEKIYNYINNFADNKAKSLHLPNRNSQF